MNETTPQDYIKTLSDKEFEIWFKTMKRSKTPLDLHVLKKIYCTGLSEGYNQGFEDGQQTSVRPL